MAKNSSTQSPTTDVMAITISSLCVLHCLAVPIIAATLPIFAALEETEWLHKLLVMLSAPVTGFALMQTRKHFIDPIFLSAAVLGLGVLVISAFLERFHPQEQIMTVAGAGLLIFAHAWRWRRHHKDVR